MIIVARSNRTRKLGYLRLIFERGGYSYPTVCYCMTKADRGSHHVHFHTQRPRQRQ